MENDNQKKKKFSWFQNIDRPDAVAEDTTPTLGYFFKLLKRKFGRLLSLNLMMVVMILPIVAAILVAFFGTNIPTTDHPAYASLLGISLEGSAPSVAAVLGIVSKQLNVPIMTTGKIIAVCLLLGFTALTWGWQNVGSAYNLRSLVRGDSCFLWSDYFYAIRRNLKQGFFFGLLDILLIVVLLFDFFYFSALENVFIIGVFYMIFLVLLFIYIVMRFYIYQMMITFDLSIKKLLKNALIFSLLGFKRNLMALLGIIVVIALNFALIMVCLSFGFSAPIILPFFYLPALMGFIATYAAWPNIQRYMIDPYEQADPDEPQADDLGESNILNSEAEEESTPPPAAD